MVPLKVVPLKITSILQSHKDMGKICIHLISLNIPHFGMVEAFGLRSMALRSPSTI
jgi:hypothetical protein